MGKMGFWGWDGSGLPTYTYTGGFPVKALDRAGRDSQMPDDPCYLLNGMRVDEETAARYVQACGNSG